MRRIRFERLGASSGIAFAALAIAAGILTGSPPGPDDTDEAWRKFFIDKHDLLLTQAWAYALAAAVPQWWRLW